MISMVLLQLGGIVTGLAGGSSGCRSGLPVAALVPLLLARVRACSLIAARCLSGSRCSIVTRIAFPVADAVAAVGGTSCASASGLGLRLGGSSFLKFEFDLSWYGAMMVRNMPPGWPQDVQPPGSEGWEATAVTWLLDLVSRYRQYDMMCRHPVILASIARHLIHGSVEGAREGYRTVRSELAEHASSPRSTSRSRHTATKGAAWRPLNVPWTWWNGRCAAAPTRASAEGLTQLRKSKAGALLSQSGDRPELAGDEQRDQIPELLSAQFDLAAVVVYERHSPVLGAVAVDHDLRDRVVRNLVARDRRRLSGLGPPPACTKENGSAPGLVRLSSAVSANLYPVSSEAGEAAGRRPNRPYAEVLYIATAAHAAVWL